MDSAPGCASSPSNVPGRPHRLLGIRPRPTGRTRPNLSLLCLGRTPPLLQEAKSPDRRFAAVICESIERVARRTYFGTKIEYELEQTGVALCAADEPILTDSRAKRATPTLTQRVKQAVSEWYVLQMLELSWDGFIEHIEQGWNIGKPPYGYLAQRVPHPVPAKREQGLTKHRLVPDPERGPIVTQIFRMRVLRRLGYAGIAAELNTDLRKYPPPQPNRADTTKHRWTASAVRSILENPTYPGYQVWNRKARSPDENDGDPETAAEFRKGIRRRFDALEHKRRSPCPVGELSRGSGTGSSR
jgi:site-specific DNA recombinase